VKAKLLTSAIDFKKFEEVFVLSPHMDDAAFSCGSLMSWLKNRIKVTVINVASADPDPISFEESPALRGIKERTNVILEPPRNRRKEDRKAMGLIGCGLIHLGFLDAIYRRDPATGKLVYPERVLGFMTPREDDLTYVTELENLLRRLISGKGPVLLIAPLGLGGHVDHIICHRMAGQMQSGHVKVLYYEDFPYNVRENTFTFLPVQKKTHFAFPFDPAKKAKIVNIYKSQIQMIFGDQKTLREQLRLRRFGKKPAEFYWTSSVFNSAVPELTRSTARNQT